MIQLTIFLWAVFIAFGLSAESVTNFSLFKVTVYQQSSPAAPTLPDHPNAYYFGAQLGFLDTQDGVVDVSISGPAMALTYFDNPATNYFNYGSPYYDLKSDFDSAFPAGDYIFEVNYTNGTSDMGILTVPANDFYTTNIAAFAPSCWTAMQQVDPSLDFTLNWNAFTPDTNTTAAYSFVDILDPSYNTVFGADFLAPASTTTNIPGGTLLYGTSYRVNAFFSDREDFPGAGFGSALGTVGFDNLTFTTLVTIPPWLRIFPSGGSVILTWPTLASNYVLAAVSNLSLLNMWSVVTNIPTAQAGTNSVVLPASAPSQFFRLQPRIIR